MIALTFVFWLFTAAAFGIVLTIPLSSEAQIVMSLGCLGFVAAMKAWRPSGVMRTVALALTSAVIIRYVFWRTTQTLPSMSDPVSAIPGYLLYAAEMYSVMMLALSMFVMVRLRDVVRTPEVADADLPTVDVFIPSYNEPAELLAKTIMAAKRMDYPEGKKVIWLLDDGGTDQKCAAEDVRAAQEARNRRELLTLMCADLGVRYLTRQRNVHAKAGNLNNGLAHSTGDIVVVFDADHAPSPKFLTRTVGLFCNDPQLAIVQTPHFFINPDPIERNLGLVGRVPSESEMFYGKIQRGLDYREGAFFCGSGALLRRAALNEVDGFSGRSITEDCESTVALHAKGWKTRYVDEVMLSGLQPETFSSFIQQRSRWAQGMVQILLLNRPFMKRGLRMSQRLSYLSSILFWLFPFSRLAFLVAPVFYIIFDLKIFTASGEDFLAYTLSYVGANLVLQNLLYGDVRRPWMSEVYEFAQSIHLGQALISILRSPTKATFKVTSKDETASEYKLSDIGGVYYWVFFAVLALQIWAFYRMFTEPHNQNLLMVVSVWNILNLLLAGTALGAVNERPSTPPAIGVRRPATLTLEDGRTVEARILSADDGGVLIQMELDTTPEPGAVMTLAVPDVHRARAETDLRCGVSVRETTGPGQVRADYRPSLEALALGCSLLYDDPEKWRKYDISKRPAGVVLGTITFLILALRQTARGLFGGPKPLVSAQ